MNRKQIITIIIVAILSSLIKFYVNEETLKLLFIQAIWFIGGSSFEYFDKED